MTLVVTSGNDGISGALIVSPSIDEVPTYRLAREPSFYDRTQSREWFYNTRALMIQRVWRLQRDIRRFKKQQAVVLRVRNERIAAYYQKRMLRLLHFIDWNGDAASFAASKIQRAFRKRYFPQTAQTQLVVVEQQDCYIWERQ
ncbi:Hypothetical protein, putative [Bodo saltans]|uniref:Uncharacterized protein n=1 Tax=Bodo saltans TaxID=75058 RepID=A0A0S4ITR6_BODSA|nr:Hypothetical protein, putative [Bodo saltans]|eukprot:CUF87330.1 Hypothetical protein, putative [Bodo saltans]